MRYVFKLASLCFITLSFLLAGCGDSGTGDDVDETTVEETIGPDGGTIMLTNKINLHIPAGALDDSVEFSIEENTSPEPLGGTLAFVTPVYSVEPSGTNFNTMTILGMFYDEGEMYGLDSTDVVLYTHDGTQWIALTTILDIDTPSAYSFISHLSDFALVVDTGGSEETNGVYALMVLGRTISSVSKFAARVDVITARFDSVYNACEAVTPLQPASVACDEYELTWIGNEIGYYYQDIMDLDFITLGENYKFTITGNDFVPSFSDSIDFPDTEVLLTSPAHGAVVGAGGFMVTWTGTGDGTVRIVLVDNTSDSVFTKDVPNTGAYAVTSDDLTGLSAGEYGLLLIYDHFDYILAEGIDPRSRIAARIFNISQITLE